MIYVPEHLCLDEFPYINGCLTYTTHITNNIGFLEEVGKSRKYARARTIKIKAQRTYDLSLRLRNLQLGSNLINACERNIFLLYDVSYQKFRAIYVDQD